MCLDNDYLLLYIVMIIYCYINSIFSTIIFSYTRVKDNKKESISKKAVIIYFILK